MSARRFYTAIIEKARDGYGVFFPDLPGCTSFGKTIARAAENARVAAQAHAVVSIEFGDELPGPRDPDEIPDDPKIAEATRFLIPVAIR
jgi:predicted RNase H-like HicB family nuclease